MRVYIFTFIFVFLAGSIFLSQSMLSNEHEPTPSSITSSLLNGLTPAAGENEINSFPNIKYKPTPAPVGPDLNNKEIEELGQDDDIFKYMSDDLLEEIQGVYDQCNTDTKMSIYYDCACRSLKYLDIRIEKGKEMSQAEILGSLKTSCPNITNIAGQAYKRCLASKKVDNSQAMETYCSCVSNKFAELYQIKKVAPETNAFYHLTTTAMVACGRFRP